MLSKVHLTGIIKRNFINSLKSLGERMIKIMDKLYLVHGNTWYDGYGYCENLYGVFTDRKTAEKVKTEVTEKLYSKNTITCLSNGLFFHKRHQIRYSKAQQA